MASSTADQPNVTAEDQQLINKFARLHQNFVQIKEDMGALMNDLQNINEACDELMLLGDDDAASIPFRIGQTFVHFDQDSMTEKLEKLKDETEVKVEGMKTDNSSVEKEMERLKSTLYAKFGDRINLETEKEE